jgi:PAS domain S-box-containing protein
VGKSIYETNAGRPERIELFERALSGEEINYLLVQDGLAFNTFIAPRYGSDGEVTGVIGVLTNISDLYQAQRELQERNAVLQLVTQKAPIMLAQIDRDGNYKQFIGEALKEQGITSDTRLGRNIKDVYPADHPLRQLYERAIGGEQHETTADFPEARTFHVIGVPNRDADGNVIDMVALGVDITARVEAERKLQRSEAFLSTVLDSAPFILTFIDTEGVIRLSMGSALTHKGFPVQELVGKSVYKTYGDNPEHIRLFNSALSGTAFRQSITLGDMSYEVSARPYADETGKIAGVVSLALDVSELKDVEDMLREREAQLTAILENTPMVLAMIDKQGRRRMMVGKLLEDLNIDPAPYLDKSIFDDPSQRPEVVAAIRGALEKDTPTTFDAEAFGRKFHVFVSPHHDAEGNVVGAVTAALDVTAAAEQEHRLRETNRDLSEWRDMVNTLLGTAPMGVALIDREMRYLYINDYLAQLNGLPPAEHIGKRAQEVIPPDVADLMQPLIEQVFDSGRPLTGIEASAESPLYPGEVRQFEAGLYPLSTADGRRVA